MDGKEKSGEPAKKLSLQEIFTKLNNLPLWDKVRRLAIRGTVPHPEREPKGTYIVGLFEVIERNDGDGVIDALEAAEHHELADQVKHMLKDYVQVSGQVPVYVVVEHKTTS